MTNSHILVGFDDVRIVVRDELRSALAEQLPWALERAFSKPYLTQAEVVGLTGWTPRQLAYRRKRGDIPYTKRGRTIWYKAEDVYAWFEAGYVPARRAR